MKWEFLGTQELPEGSAPGRGHVYRIAMWRTPVPGGWLICSLNTRSDNPQPVQIFYPDEAHTWTGRTPPEAEYLLRAAGAGTVSAPQALLRPADGTVEGVFREE